MSERSSVATIDRASRMLAEAVTLEDIKAVHDLATAAVEYAKAAKLGEEAERHAATIKLRAERKAGELFEALERDRGESTRFGRPTSDTREPSPYAAALDESGTTRQDANRWEKVAEVPEELFEEYLHEAAEPTTSGLLNEKRQAEKRAAQQDREEQKKAQASTSPTRPVIALADYRQWFVKKVPCDLLLTDPPYSTDVAGDFTDFVRSWLPVALAKVSPTGRAYICVGAYPHELSAYLMAASGVDSMDLAQVLVWTYRNTLGPKPTHTYKQNWQAVLYFVGPEAMPLDCPEMLEQFSVQDINAPDGRQGDRYHAWQKPDELAERFIRHATKPGDLVYDCFAGTGTHLLAAARLGRVGIGCDSDPEMVDIAESRGCLHAR